MKGYFCFAGNKLNQVNVSKKKDDFQVPIKLWLFWLNVSIEHGCTLPNVKSMCLLSKKRFNCCVGSVI